MTTYYVNYYDVLRGELLPWMKWPLVRVTRNSLGREVREVVGSGLSIKDPREYGKMEMRAGLSDPPWNCNAYHGRTVAI